MNAKTILKKNVKKLRKMLREEEKLEELRKQNADAHFKSMCKAAEEENKNNGRS